MYTYGDCVALRLVVICRLLVRSPVAPRFTEEPADTTAVQGQSTFFTCDATGNPQPVITWLKDGN